MFSKFIGQRVTAVATALAVVVGLAITPAFTATAAEGEDPVIVPQTTEVVEEVTPPAEPVAPVVSPAEPPAPTPLVELVETPAPETPAEEPPAEETPASETPAPLVEPGATPPPLAETPTPLVELGATPPVTDDSPESAVRAVGSETPAEETPAPQRMMRSSIPEQPSSMGIQAAGITPESLPSEFLLGEDLDVQFGGVDADRWDMNFDFLSNANLSNSGHLTGYFSRPGWHTLTVKAQDWKWLWWDTVATKSYTFKVVPAVLTSAPLDDATVGDSYSEQLDGTLAQGVYQPSKFSKVSGTLPPGLNLSDTGVISGIVQSVPANPKTYTFEVRLTVGNWLTGRFHSAPKTLSITVGYPAPTWNTITLPDATVGETYPVTSVTANGNGWAVGTYTATGLPNGLTLSSDGVLSGTPLFNSSYDAIETVTVTFTADNGKSTTTTADLVVKTPPKFVTTSPLPNGIVGMAYSQQLTADGHNVRFVVPQTSSLPAGLTLESDGLLHGAPTVAGEFTFDIRARNLAGKVVQSFTVTVTQPVMTLSSSKIIRGNTVTVIGSGYLPGDTLELWLHSTPVQLGTITATNGTFSSTVRIPAGTAAGQHHLVVNAAQSGTQSVPLTVAVQPAAPQRPQSTPQSQSPRLTVTPAEDTPPVEVVEETEIEETEGETEEAEEEELPTLDQPEAEEEAAAETPANLSGLLYAGFAVLLAALILWFILWRRRRATES